MTERVSAERRLRPGKASNYIKHAHGNLHPGKPVLLCLRVSGHAQNQRGNKADQTANLRNVAAHHGALVVGSLAHVGSGYDPVWLARAVHLAAQHGAALLAESTDRFVRNPAYDKENQDWQARDLDLRWLAHCVEGIELLTDLDPDATPAEVRAYQRRRGQSLKGRKGGRPVPGKLARRRKELLPVAQRMIADGKSRRATAKELEVDRRTLGRWLEWARGRGVFGNKDAQ